VWNKHATNQEADKCTPDVYLWGGELELVLLKTGGKPSGTPSDLHLSLQTAYLTDLDLWEIVKAIVISRNSLILRIHT